MLSKQFGLFILGVLAILVAVSAVSAASLADWTLTSNASPSNVATNVQASNLTAGSGVSGLTFTTNGATGTGWNQGAVGASDYYQVTLTVASGFTANIASISFDQVSSNPTTNMNFDVSYSKDNFATSTNLVTAGVSTTSSSTSTTSTNIALNSGETLTLRIFGYNSDNSSTETFSVKNLNLQGTVSQVTQPVIPSEITSCSAKGNTGNLRVKKIDFTNNGLSGSSPVTFGKNDEWFPRENIEVEIQVKNDGRDRVNNIEVDWGVYNTRTNEWVIEPIDEKDFDLKDGKTETLTVSFNLDKDLDVDLSDLTDGDNYKFYVIATGEVDDGNDTESCAFKDEPASVVIESDFVVLDNIDLPETLQCGQNVQVTANAWNVGDNDQDEVSVDVFGRENILGINENVKVGDIDSFDSKRMLFSFDVPNNLENGKIYALTFQVLDEDGDLYQNDFDDDNSEFVAPFKVEGCSGSGNGSSSGKVSIAASLVSGGKANQDLVVKATIKNNENALKTFQVSASGFSEWADDVSSDKTTLVLGSGQSNDVTFTFNVKSDASGNYNFFIETLSDSEVTRQPVSVNIEPSSRGGITGNAILGDNWPIWVIGFLNLILVIVIIIVAVRVAKKK